MPDTLGTFLINQKVPPKYRLKPGTQVNKKVLKDLLVQIAREEGPDVYAKVVIDLKQLGDKLSTTEMFSPGLDDLTSPPGATAFLDNLDRKVKAATSNAKKVDLMIGAQKKSVDLALQSKGALREHVISGSRGKPVQLQKMIVSPIASGGAKKGISPVVIKHSYSHGLSGGEYFATAMEARQNAMDTYIQVQKPGTISKTFTSNLNDLLITEKECGTTNGLYLNVSDSNVLDRYTAEKTPHFSRNSLVDSLLLKRLTNLNIERVKVRSPQTCESKDGVCAYCYGLLENKQLGEIGTNVGVRSAQALSEPLAQWSLDKKHAARLASKGLQGFEAVEQLIKVPKNFINKAVVAQVPGKVTSISGAPQGGNYVTIERKRHYIEPGFDVKVRVGQTLEAGDVLSEGVPSPQEIVHYKGLGAGRNYYTNALHTVYKNEGLDIDRRHLENLSKKALNYVRVMESDPDLDLYQGETIPYNKLRGALKKKSELVRIEDAVNKNLAKDYTHYTVGTMVTPSIARELKALGIRQVQVTTSNIKLQPIMRSADVTPLMNPDLLAKMGFKNLKKSFVQGVQQGARSDIHGTSPWPGYMYGKEFGSGDRGHY